MMTIHWLVGGVSSLQQLRSSNLASVRLRAACAATHLAAHGVSQSFGEDVQGVPDVLVVCKIGANNIGARGPAWLSQIHSARQRGTKVVIDYTDHHLGHASPMSDFYRQAMPLSDLVIVPSELMKRYASEHFAGPILHIFDSVEYVSTVPHPIREEMPVLMWFGHPSNLEFLLNFLDRYDLCDRCHALLTVTDNAGLSWIESHRSLFKVPRLTLVPWSIDGLRKAAIVCDVALIPAGLDDPRKSGASANRLITALALGLPVITHSLESYRPYREFYTDIDSDSFLDVLQNPGLEHEKVLRAQQFLVPKFSQAALGDRWQLVLERAAQGGDVSCEF